MFLRHLIIFLLFIYSFPRGVSTQAVANSAQCSFGSTPKSSMWSQCDCVPVGVEPSLHVICHQMSSATIPPLPNVETHPNNTPDILALSMVKGALAFIQQDAFKGQNIQTLDFSHNHIQTVNVNAFRGLEMKLTLLNLRNNNLSVIPAWALTYLHHLQFLHLENNRITHVRANTFDETQLNSLQFLHLDYNKLSSLPNLCFNRLRIIVLTLSNNRIEELEKMSLPSTLSFLDLRNNLLTHIPFLALKELKELQTLNLEGNNITRLGHHPEVSFNTEMNVILRSNKIRHLDKDSFRSFRKIQELDLSYNQISTIAADTFETVGKIESLDLSYNSIAYIPRGTLKNFAKNLERLNLEENMIHTLPVGLMDLHSLRYLNLNGNKLNTLADGILDGFKKSTTELLLAYNQLQEVPSQVLNGMEKLQHLDLSKNRIESIERLAFGTFDGSGTSLMILNLAGNHIRNISDPGIFLYMNTLAYLDLSYNHIEHLGPKAFEKLPGLEKLFLQNNNLNSFPLSALYNMQKLRHLLLDQNRIRHLPSYLLGDLQHLEHLSLANNQITHIDDRIFHSSSTLQLKSLNLGGNAIEFVGTNAFANLENLEHLRLADNKIRSLPSIAFVKLPNLRVLDLSGNRLLQIATHTFSDLPNIEHLQLQENEIEGIEKDAFHLINKISHLDLSHNKLRKIDCDCMGTIASVLTLDLSFNDINKLDLPCIKRSLRRLNLAHNSIETIRRETMENFDQLTHLSLRNNKILEIQSHSLELCLQLSSIDLSHNHIRTIWRGTFTHQALISHLNIASNALLSVQRGSMGKNNLLSVDLSNNELTRLPIDALETVSDSLSHLNLANNRLKLIDSPQLVGLKNVSELRLERNQIESVEEAAFEHLTSLRTLHLSHNPISSWSPAAFRDLSHSITTLNLAATGLFSIPKLNHRAISHLNISWNKIYELTKSELAPINKVVTLDLSNNNLKAIESDVFDDLGDLKHLNISGNPIASIGEQHFKNLYQLESLNIVNMPALESLPVPQAYSHLTNLKELWIYGIPYQTANYNVSEILRHVPPLRSLSIEIKDHKVKHQLHGMDKRLLRKLMITGENVTKIHVGAFHGIRGYKVELSIENTSISDFPSTIFNTLTNVNYLSLSLKNNRLDTIDPFKNTDSPMVNQHGTILQQIQLEGNPLRCDCSMSWLAAWLDSLDDRNQTGYSTQFCANDRTTPLLTYYQQSSAASECVNHVTALKPLLPIVIFLTLFLEITYCNR